MKENIDTKIVLRPQKEFLQSGPSHITLMKSHARAPGARAQGGKFSGKAY